MKVTTINHYPSNPNVTHGVTKEIVKPHVVVPQIKQCQVATTNNPQYANKSESLRLQVKKIPIDGNSWAHHNALLATIRRKLQSSVIVHPIQNSHMVFQKRLQNPIVH
jgi:hypothetical protein